MIRLAKLEDLDKIQNIYAHARLFMASTGNPNQWVNNYPSCEILQNDINKGHLHVCYDDQGIYGVFVFFVGVDETYGYIEGAWLNNEEYGVIHRVASSGAKKGMFTEVYEYVCKFIDNIRIDTHHDNLVMQNILNKHEFIAEHPYCVAWNQSIYFEHVFFWICFRNHYTFISR